MRKSEQLIVEVSLGNAKSLVRLTGKQVLEGAVGSNFKGKDTMFQTQSWPTQLHTAFSSHSNMASQLLLESRMREIRLSGLNGGLPLQDAGRDLP